MKRIHHIVFGAALATAPLGVWAQTVPVLKLKPADVRLEEEFTAVGSVRELRDGRILVSDPREARVVVIDPRTGAVAPVGRTGKGPNEYSMAAPIRPIGGDSSIMFDPLTRRWLLLDGAKIVVTMPPDAPIVTAMKGYALGADSRGSVWKTDAPAPTGSGGRSESVESWKAGTYDTEATDSAYLLRGSRATGKLDTVAKLRPARSRQTVRADAKGKFQSVAYSRPPLAVGEEVAIFPDGYVAIARLAPYRVDWIIPDGRVAKGAPLPVPVQKFDDRERDAYLARQQAASARSINQIPEAFRADVVALRDQFPDAYPPFVANGLIAGENGQLFVRRPATADFPDYRYDVIDRRGRIVGVLGLAKGERIVTVSPTKVYVVWKDDDDIERVRRHPWP
jgi:hypothetical protein